jgi:hypothetical protein
MMADRVDALLLEQLATVERMLETRRTVGGIFRDVRARLYPSYPPTCPPPCA